MEPNYKPPHYAAQNREELGKALSRDTLELSAEKFHERLDQYDHINWCQLNKPDVPKPNITSQKQTTAEKQKEEKVDMPIATQREFCDYLNRVISLLPCT
jgi:hypothetical protein